MVKIEQALYGLIEAAMLWYEEFTSFLKKLRFVPNPYDPCVLNLDTKGETCTLVLYVDDCFVDRHNPEALDYIEQKTAKYGGCTRTNGDLLGCYLTSDNMVDGNIGIPIVTYAWQLCTYVVTD